jgi:hypothetical protein
MLVFIFQSVFIPYRGAVLPRLFFPLLPDWGRHRIVGIVLIMSEMSSGVKSNPSVPFPSSTTGCLTCFFSGLYMSGLWRKRRAKTLAFPNMSAMRQYSFGWWAMGVVRHQTAAGYPARRR